RTVHLGGKLFERRALVQQRLREIAILERPDQAIAVLDERLRRRRVSGEERTRLQQSRGEGICTFGLRRRSRRFGKRWLCHRTPRSGRYAAHHFLHRLQSRERRGFEQRDLDGEALVLGAIDGLVVAQQQVRDAKQVGIGQF